MYTYENIFFTSLFYKATATYHGRTPIIENAFWTVWFYK